MKESNDGKIADTVILIRCPRCNEINSILNIECCYCSYADIARRKIVNRGIVKPLFFSFLSVFIFPLNFILGIFCFLLIIFCFMAFYFGIPSVPLVAIGKLFGSFKEISYWYLFLDICFIFSIFIIYRVMEYAACEIGPPLLNNIFSFLFPSLLVFYYMYDYEPRLALSNIAKEASCNSKEILSKERIENVLSLIYKERDNIIYKTVCMITSEKDDRYRFYGSFWYDFFENFDIKKALIGHIVWHVILAYIFIYFIYKYIDLLLLSI